MSPLRSLNAQRLPLLLAAVVLTIGLSACGLSQRPVRPTAVSAEEIAAGSEPYFWAGNVTYQVQITRQLNPFNTEDVQYLAGVQNAQNLPPDDLWYGVFLWAKNQTKHNVTTSDTFTIVDSSGTVYHPIALNPSINPYAWTAQSLAPDGIEPNADTTAAFGPTQGGLILFELSDSVYSNRPLTLDIYAPGQTKPSTVSLDL
jgi:hypothetical protein